ncbi:unnamed protein product, partial [Rhizophagus irregularis]
GLRELKKFLGLH